MLQRYIIDPQTGEKRFNLELFLPLGGMIIVGITGLILGIVFFQPNEVPDDGPIDLPSVESYQSNWEKHNQRTTPTQPTVGDEPSAGVTGADAGVTPDAGSPPALPPGVSAPGAE